MFLAVSWSLLIGIPSAALATLALLAGLARLIILALRHDRATEALRIANETKQLYKELSEAQHETNVDIDRRLEAANKDRTEMASTIARQNDTIAGLNGVITTRNGLMDRMERQMTERIGQLEKERDWCRRRLDRILAWLALSGIALPDDVAGDTMPPTP